MFELVFKDALLKDGFTSWEGDLAVEDGKIAALGANLAGRKEIRVDGKWLLPGALDVHTHMSLPFAGAISSDDFFTGTRAAAFGGVTTIIDFTSQKPGEGIRAGFERRIQEAEEKSVIDFGFHACIGKFTLDVRNDLSWAVENGLTSLKVFMAYRKAGLMLDDEALFRALEETARHNILLTVHAESGMLIDSFIETLGMEGKIDIENHVASHPVFTEVEAIQRLISFTEATKSRVYVVHVSCGSSAQLIGSSRSRSVSVFGETCPQYLFLNDDLLVSPKGHLYACTPPVRSITQQPGLWKELAAGNLSVIATDHCPFTKKDKNTWTGDFRKIPMGLPGIETMLPLILGKSSSHGVFHDQAIRCLTVNPARIFGLYPRKGSLIPGADADLVIYNPDRKVKIKNSLLHMQIDYSPYEGMEVKGWPEMTVSQGKVIVDKDKFFGKPGRGKFLKRERAMTD